MPPPPHTHTVAEGAEGQDQADSGSGSASGTGPTGRKALLRRGAMQDRREGDSVRDAVLRGVWRMWAGLWGSHGTRQSPLGGGELVDTSVEALVARARGAAAMERAQAVLPDARPAEEVRVPGGGGRGGSRMQMVVGSLRMGWRFGSLYLCIRL